MGMIVDIHACVGQMRVVETLESVEIVCALLRCTVATHEVAVEIYAHFGHHSRSVVTLCRGYLNARDEVFLAVGAQLTYGQLASGEYHGLGRSPACSSRLMLCRPWCRCRAE